MPDEEELRAGADSRTRAIKRKREKELQLKKGRDITASLFPSLGPLVFGSVDGRDRRFVILQRAGSGPDGGFKETSKFVLFKSLKSVSSRIESAKLLNDGSILIKCPTDVANLLVDTVSLPGIEGEVKMTLHGSLNRSRGVFFDAELRNISEADITRELREQNPLVRDVKAITRRSETGPKRNGLYVVTFESPVPPAYIMSAFERISVRPWYPSPRRCRKCHSFQHLMDKCSKQEICVSCGVPVAADHVCQRVFCIKCEQEDHPADSSSCPAFLFESNVLKVKVDRMISYNEAKAFVSSSGGLLPPGNPSFAAVTAAPLPKAAPSVIRAGQNVPSTSRSAPIPFSVCPSGQGVVSALSPVARVKS